jgi:uncharacterized paraquat-inducible protein A
MAAESNTRAHERPDGDDVRCLACGQVYVKPVSVASGTNPHCPRCGYVGWLSAWIPLGATRPDAAPRLH